MRRPSFQWYPADWRNNANLRRCTWASRGAWVDVLGLFHDSDEYGVLRWPWKQIAAAIGCQPSYVRELIDKSVLKGCDVGQCDAYVYVPRSGRVDGAPVTLVAQQSGPVWYSSRMVRDEYIRVHRATFGDAPKASPMPTFGDAPTPPIGPRTRAHPPAQSSSSSEDQQPNQNQKTGRHNGHDHGKSNEANGTRLPRPWELPDDWKRWALNLRPEWDDEAVIRVSLMFRDHWYGKPGKDGRKADWYATWCNWVRRTN